jgi:hypothetical protein
MVIWSTAQQGLDLLHELPVVVERDDGCGTFNDHTEVGSDDDVRPLDEFPKLGQELSRAGPSQHDHIRVPRLDLGHGVGEVAGFPDLMRLVFQHPPE